FRSLYPAASRPYGRLWAVAPAPVPAGPEWRRPITPENRYRTSACIVFLRGAFKLGVFGAARRFVTGLMLQRFGRVGGFVVFFVAVHRAFEAFDSATQITA